MDVIIGGMHPQKAPVTIPSSKSISHRMLIGAALAEGTSVLHGIDMNDDIQATAEALCRLGAAVECNGDVLTVTGGMIRPDGTAICCGESASTLRFLIPVSALSDQKTVFTGRGRLMERPLQIYEEIFSRQALLFERKNDTLTVQGPLRGGTFEIDGNISSQFISGLLFALPLVHEDSRIIIRPPFASASYVRLTADVLSHAGICITETADGFLIPGKQKYRPFEMKAEGDDSQAAFFAVLSAISGRELQADNMRHDSRQGDHVILRILRDMGCAYEETESGYRFLPGHLHGTEIDLGDCPDLGPVLFALASQAEGETVFLHAGRLRLKESDRIAAMETELRKLGCIISSSEDTVRVHGKTAIRGNTVLDGHGDHRIVMALSVLSAIADGPVRISGAEAVNKSYPSFFEDFRKAGGEADEYQ